MNIGSKRMDWFVILNLLLKTEFMKENDCEVRCRCGCLCFGRFGNLDETGGDRGCGLGSFA